VTALDRRPRTHARIEDRAVYSNCPLQFESATRAPGDSQGIRACMATDSGLDPNLVVNLAGANVLVVDGNSFTAKLMGQIMLGVGVRRVRTCANGNDARALLSTGPVDLLMVTCDLPEDEGYDLVKWMRREGGDNNTQTTTIMITGHTRIEKVAKARDCGANYILGQPFSPTMLLERIVRLARDKRGFLDSGDYVGPDRRFRSDPPPDGVERRTSFNQNSNGAED
jgi:DNA-binding response OmpR family regulator